MNRIDKQHQLLCIILLIARPLYLVFGINICFIFSRTRLPGHVLGLGHIILETFLTIILAFVHKLKYSNEVDENLKWLQKDNSSKFQLDYCEEQNSDTPIISNLIWIHIGIRVLYNSVVSFLHESEINADLTRTKVPSSMIKG